MKQEKKKVILYLIFAVIMALFCICAMIYFIWKQDMRRIFPMALCAVGSVIICIRFFLNLRKIEK